MNFPYLLFKRKRNMIHREKEVVCQRNILYTVRNFKYDDLNNVKKR